jgi:hypothetical protein
MLKSDHFSSVEMMSGGSFNRGGRDLKRELMHGPEFVHEHEALGPEHELTRSIIPLRIRKSLAQKRNRGSEGHSDESH